MKELVKKTESRILNEEGFSLIELLIVMVILGLLAGLVGPKLFGHVDSSKQKTAKSQISLFESALDTYRLDNGKFPTSEQGLKALRERPEGEARWKGPYLPKEVPLDPWGHPYLYRAPGEHGDYDLIAYGADNSPGGEGNDTDIVSWQDLK